MNKKFEKITEKIITIFVLGLVAIGLAAAGYYLIDFIIEEFAK